jgi:hypothetical protein
VEAEKLSEYFMLPHGVQPLLIEVHQAFFTSVDDELSKLKIDTPLFDNK